MSHHSVPSAAALDPTSSTGVNSPAVTRPVAASRLRACSTTNTPRPNRVATAAGRERTVGSRVPGDQIADRVGHRLR